MCNMHEHVKILTEINMASCTVILARNILSVKAENALNQVKCTQQE